jgi:hypothetical protein
MLREPTERASPSDAARSSPNATGEELRHTPHGQILTVTDAGLQDLRRREPIFGVYLGGVVDSRPIELWEAWVRSEPSRMNPREGSDHIFDIEIRIGSLGSR